MANTVKTKKTTVKPKTTVKEVVETVDVEGTVAEEKIVESATVKPERKKYADDDMIPCVSITPGELFFMGERSKNLYTWADADDVIEVEYRDLNYAARSRNKIMYKPRFVVQDREFVEQFKELDAVYTGLYEVKDLKAILDMPTAQMMNAIAALPPGALDAIKSLAMGRIQSGRLDSIQKVKALDEYFDTNMLMRLIAN